MCLGKGNDFEEMIKTESISEAALKKNQVFDRGELYSLSVAYILADQPFESQSVTLQDLAADMPETIFLIDLTYIYIHCYIQNQNIVLY